MLSSATISPDADMHGLMLEALLIWYVLSRHFIDFERCRILSGLLAGRQAVRLSGMLSCDGVTKIEVFSSVCSCLVFKCISSGCQSLLQQL